MRLPKRRTVWLTAALLVIIVVGIWSVALRSRVTRANFDRIRLGMKKAEVCAILGVRHESFVDSYFWFDGPNYINVSFLPNADEAFEKAICLATAWETLQWYAKKGAEMVGVKWD